MNNNELYPTNEVLEVSGNEFDPDLTLDKTDPWLLIETYTGADVEQTHR